jgi:hypothetical protein
VKARRETAAKRWPRRSVKAGGAKSKESNIMQIMAMAMKA